MKRFLKRASLVRSEYVLRLTDILPPWTGEILGSVPKQKKIDRGFLLIN